MAQNYYGGFYSPAPTTTTVPKTTTKPSVVGFYRIGNDVYDPQGNYISFDKAQQIGIVPLLESIPHKPSQPVSTFDPSKYGIDPGLFNSLSPAEKAFVEASGGIIQNQFDAGSANVSVNADLFNKAMQSAQNDPDIIAKYGDALKLNQGN